MILSVKRAVAMKRTAGGELDRVLPSGQCVWPLDDLDDPEFRFYRKSAAGPGEPYCPEHRSHVWTAWAVTAP